MTPTDVVVIGGGPFTRFINRYYEPAFLEVLLRPRESHTWRRRYLGLSVESRLTWQP